METSYEHWDVFLEQYAIVCNERDNLKLEVEHLKVELEFEKEKIDVQNISNSEPGDENRVGEQEGI